MKAQVVIVELVVVALVLLVAFGALLPSLTYTNRWSDATLLQTERDLILTADASGMLNTISFDQTAFQNYVSQTIGNTGIIFWSTAEGSFGPKITVACNCTPGEISELNQWIGTFELNNQTISLDFVPATLDNIPDSNVLLIFNFTNIEPYKSNLLNYIGAGNGIVDLTDLQQNDITSTYTQIFGLVGCTEGPTSCGTGSSTVNTISVPTNTSSPIFDQYNLFYHMPIPASASNPTSSIPVENGIQSCASTAYGGNFTIQGTANDFWTCGNSVYFDTNQNGLADTIVQDRQSFTLDGFNLFMSYVQQNYIYVSFRPVYSFANFLSSGIRISPANGEEDRIFVSGGTYPGKNKDPIPAVVVNGTSTKVAWIADFTSQGVVGNDEKLLLASLIFASANVQNTQVPFGALQNGLITSYVNVVNYDMFEVYKFDVGGGYPF